VTIVKPAEGLILNMRPRGSIVEQLVEEVWHTSIAAAAAAAFR
jgi:hypothetical protein